MQSCSIRGCQSYKSIQWKPVAYFKFPFNNNKLLNAWLSQIDQKNFTPTIQDQICSTHFLIEDIEPTSIGRYPILKPDAVPSVFPDNEKQNSPVDVANTVQSPKFETILIPDYSNNRQIPILPKPPLLPAANVTPQIGKILTSQAQPAATLALPINPLQIQRIQFPTNTQFTKLATSSPTPIQQVANPLHAPSQLSSIVAKKSPTPSTKQITKSNGKLTTPVKYVSQLQEILENKKNISPSNSLPKVGSAMNENNTGKLDSKIETRRPILKISINKLNDETSIKKDARKLKQQKTEEYLVKSSKKSVIFRLNPSGEIVVETLENESKGKTKPKQIVNEREKSTRKSLDPKLANLKTLYTKAQNDCEKLSIKLATLKKRHQEEQEHILKLQGLISMPKNNDLGKIETKKRKIIPSSKEDEDEYEKLLREVRKIKDDRDSKPNTRVICKEALNVKREQLSLDYDYNNDDDNDEPIVTQDETINTTMSNREHQKKLQKKVTFMKQALQEQKFSRMPEIKKNNLNSQKKNFSTFCKKEEKICEIGKNDEIVGVINDEVDFDSDDEMNFEVEYLDPEFVDC